jgi:hypothetical protein
VIEFGGCRFTPVAEIVSDDDGIVVLALDRKPGVS